ncbi:hypothetical protein VTJ49DRAFT_1150 [Mycothermus thermophilus]|uniref:Uncharacterized protein n=1 Tax=Humicola insolens TaxID=85995 RepID=A0ABR3VPI6_HUMIN
MDDYFNWPQPFLPLEVVLMIQATWGEGNILERHRKSTIDMLLTNGPDGCGLDQREAEAIMLRAATEVLHGLFKASVDPNEVGHKAFFLMVWACIYERVGTVAYPWTKETTAAMISHLVLKNTGRSTHSAVYEMFVELSKKHATGLARLGFRQYVDPDYRMPAADRQGLWNLVKNLVPPMNPGLGPFEVVFESQQSAFERCFGEKGHILERLRRMYRHFNIWLERGPSGEDFTKLVVGPHEDPGPQCQNHRRGTAMNLVQVWNQLRLCRDLASDKDMASGLLELHRQFGGCDGMLGMLGDEVVTSETPTPDQKSVERLERLRAFNRVKHEIDNVMEWDDAGEANKQWFHGLLDAFLGPNQDRGAL